MLQIAVCISSDAQVSEGLSRTHVTASRIVDRKRGSDVISAGDSGIGIRCTWPLYKYTWKGKTCTVIKAIIFTQIIGQMLIGKLALQILKISQHMNLSISYI